MSNGRPGAMAEPERTKAQTRAAIAASLLVVQCGGSL